jgi:chemotaxis protein MotB
MAAHKRRGGAHDEEHENAERWLLTYADMITLLMAFFIIMFSISQLDLAKFQEFREGVISHFGGRGTPVMPGGDGNLKGGTAPLLDMPVGDKKGLGSDDSKLSRAQAERQSFKRAERQIGAALAAKGLAKAASQQVRERGLVITIKTDAVLFDLGSAALRPDGRRILDALAGGLATLPNPVAVEGHTDDLPIHGARFPSNWELSTARASAVVRHLIQHGHLGAARLSATGYADERPLMPNDTPAHRARNRRVEVVVVATANDSGKEQANG